TLAGKASLVPAWAVGAVDWVCAAGVPAQAMAARRTMASLDIEIRHLESIVLNEVAARLDDVAHQGREDLVRLVGMVDLDLKERPRLGIERGLPKLVAVHLAQALVALDGEALAAGLEHGGVKLGRRGDRRLLV